MRHLQDLFQRKTTEIKSNGGNMRAKIIAIEGCDGCGKETQAELLKKYLVNNGVNCKIASFPNYSSPSSELVKLFLAGKFDETTAAQRTTMYSLDRSLTMGTSDIQEFLDNPNNVLICDRYMSSLVYDTVDDPEEELVSRFKAITHIENEILAVPMPDVMVFMNLDDKYNQRIIDERKQADDATDIYEADNSFLARIRRNVRRISANEELKSIYNIVPIHCNNDERRFTIEEVTEMLIEVYNTLEVK